MRQISLGAEWATRTSALMGLLAQGFANLGFVGGAEVDRFGNLNTSYIGDRAHPQVKLPGSGGGADIASLAGRLAIILAHDKRRFPERVSYITSPGYGDGETGGACRPATWWSSCCHYDAGRARLHRTPTRWSYAHGIPVPASRMCAPSTGWDLRIAPTPTRRLSPTADELRIIRECDPQGFWTR